MKSIDPVDALKRYREKFPTQSKAAEALGISGVYMSDLLNRRRDCPAWLLDKLGLEQIVTVKQRTT